MRGTHTRKKKGRAAKGTARVNAAAKTEDWVSDEEEAAPKLQKWAGSDEEGSSDDEVDNQKERVMNQGYVQSAPIARVLCKKGGAFAVILDLGAGVEGFVPIRELSADDEIREALAHKLATIRPPPAPAAGAPDRRPRMKGLAVHGAGEKSHQVVLSGRGARVAEESLAAAAEAPEHVKALLLRLHDRDRVTEAMGLNSLAVGQVVEGAVLQRNTDGAVMALTPSGGHAGKNRNIVGVAVGANAIFPATAGHADPLATPSSTALPLGDACPGTPGSVAASEASNASSKAPGGLKKLRAGSLPVRILDIDPMTGFIDVACTPTVANTKAATDKKILATTYKSLRKKIGQAIPVQVVLRKPEYAIVISRAFSGIIGYLALKASDKVKSGDRITAKVEFVRQRPTPQNVNHKANRQQGKKPLADAAAAGAGRTLLDDEEEMEFGNAKGTPKKGDAAAPGTPAASPLDGKSGKRLPPFDGWLCAEAFAVLTVARTAAQLEAERKAKEAMTVTVTDLAPPKSKAMGTAPPAEDAKPKKEDAKPKKAKAKKEAAQKRTRDDVEAEAEAEAEAAPSGPSLAEVLAAANATAPAGEKKKATIDVGFGVGDEPMESGDDEEEAAGSKKKKRKKANARAENELIVDEMERARQEGGEPKTIDDFERLVMASPHSSYVWCQFMAFHVTQREYEQARLTAERALKTINYRESEELANVWVAYLNVENLYGTPESLHAVFQRFVQHSDDPMKAYTALTQIGKASDHRVLVEKTYQTMLKKFGQNHIAPWVDFVEYLLSKGLHDEVQKLQKRMLHNSALGEKMKIDILVKIGCMEYRQGSIDKGRTIFEGLLVKYPKRTDLWSVYLDMEQVVLPRLDDLTRIRTVFDRVTSLNLSSKKMQYFMTRYMTFEKQKGSADRVEYVKKRAIEFVNAKLGEAEE